MLSIVGNGDLSKFDGNSIYNEIVEIKSCNAHINCQFPVFENAHTVFFTQCDKNFMYYWLYPQNFPKLKILYIDGDPCEKTIYYRFDDIDIYWIDVYYNIYKHRWAQTDERIKSISRELIENVKQKLLLDRDHCPIQ